MQNIESLSLNQLVKIMGGTMVHDFSAQMEMDYVVVSAKTGAVQMEVTYSQTCCYFFHSPMFLDGKWRERVNTKSCYCIRADVWAEMERKFHAPASALFSTFAPNRHD